MRKINDFMGTMNIGDMKRESIYVLSKEAHIQKFLKNNHVDPALMDDNWVEFLDYNDDFKICVGCKSLES
ncbi:MAG: ATP-binding protein, partial [Coprobacillus sp.]